MKSATLNDMAKRHCSASRPRMTFAAFLRDEYKVSPQFFADVINARRNASAKLLCGIAQAHMRLFPSEPVLLVLPNNHPPVVLGDPSKLHTSN